ncbi:MULTISPECIES: glycosyltransferase family 1 protein [unclassified Dolichospermum]|uniref:glycosyltransferase family 4 protein n=1 Tax=unclassified Dolichospermum TaxID=2622029 RepID=UPI0014461476|nr:MULTISPECIES: glycosyltransferase family 1 protein [unclassified Dolichospermum]MTJ18428.1 glycosyltransferase family 4 protein [Dolichospermum sp. UHCC 0299]MTJ37622.1 glycosyltransferase family 4 protein [Dolichospermum sp. UHCC 0406]
MPLLTNLSFLLTKPTGTTTYALNLLPHLQKLEPILLTSQSLPDYNCYQTPPNLTSEQGLKGHLNRLVWTQFQLPKIYQNLKSQLLFSPIPEAPLYTNCRFIVTAFDMIPLRFPNRLSPLTTYHKYYTPEVFKQAEHIICISESTANDIIQFYQIPSHKITPILLAGDSSHFQFLNLPTRNYFLYVGRQDPYKNLQRLITAFSALPHRNDYELWLAGPYDQRYSPLLEIQTQELGISHLVKFLNYVSYDELPIIINQAIALVFPSLWEGFGLPVLEAMACGTPVITSNVSSLPEVAGDAAILINPYNIEEITAAMKIIINDSETRKQLSEKGLKRANQFSWEKTGLVTVEVLKKYL